MLFIVLPVEFKHEDYWSSPERSQFSPECSNESSVCQSTEFAFKCSICPKGFDSKDELTIHIKNHFKSYTCPICGKEFVGDTSYEYHKTRHDLQTEVTISQVVSCKVCDKKLPDATALKDHIKEEHTSSEDISCEHCSETFQSENRLNRHISQKHFLLNGEAVSCDICGRVCPNHEAVTAHRRTHNDDKDFQCDYCGKGFSRKKNLEFHIRSHTGLRPFQCKMCPKSFATVSGLNCHVRTHTKERPFKCPFCEKCYIHSTDLRRHRRSHGGEEKRFQCEICDMKFFERKYLTVHKKTHNKMSSQVINIEMVMLKEDDEGTDELGAPIDEEYVF